MKIADILLKRGIITSDQIREARQEAQRTGLTIQRSLERLGFITERDAARAMADEMGVPYMDLDGYVIDQDVIKLVPQPVAQKYKLVPLFKIANSLTVAMANPQDIIAIDEIRKRSGFNSVEPVLATEKDISAVQGQYYGTAGTLEEMIKVIGPVGGGRSAGKPAQMAEDISVIKLVNLLVAQAVSERASDIHVEPDTDVLRIRYRIDGILHERVNVPKRLESAVISRIKVMSKMDIAEKRKPQDGRFMLKMQDKEIDIRVSLFPTIHGENAVLRILDKSGAVKTLDELGMDAETMLKFSELIKKPHGIVLVTGPTGSGKTTTLYAALLSINSMEKNIITIEDPVEYELPLIRQTQVNPKAGLAFASGLRSILRQDPDIILVGEIRDKETVDISIQAALTGHLVFSTLHTNDAAGAITRLMDMGVEPFLISSTITGILAQRLLRVICDKCKEEYHPQEELLKKLGLKEDTVFYRGKGCRRCGGTGFYGRAGIYELLLMDENLRKMTVAGISSGQIKRSALDSGMRSIYKDGMEKVMRGITTITELMRVIETA